MVLEFSQRDLSKIEPPDRNTPFDEMTHIISVDLFEPFKSSNPAMIDDGQWAKVCNYQKVIRAFLDWFYAAISSNWQITYTQAFTQETTLKCGSNANNGRFTVYSPAPVTDQKKIKAIYRAIPDQEQTQNIIIPPGMAKFIKAIDGWPSASFLVCPHCGKRYFNRSRRAQRYCSYACRNAAGSLRYLRKIKSEE
jgi:hypothetical protein